jgi:hypothetical protein
LDVGESDGGDAVRHRNEVEDRKDPAPADARGRAEQTWHTRSNFGGRIIYSTLGFVANLLERVGIWEYKSQPNKLLALSPQQQIY